MINKCSLGGRLRTTVAQTQLKTVILSSPSPFITGVSYKSPQSARQVTTPSCWPHPAHTGNSAAQEPVSKILQFSSQGNQRDLDVVVTGNPSSALLILTVLGLTEEQCKTEDR